MTMVFTQSMTSVTKVTLVVESASRWNTSTHTIFIHWTESWPEFQGLHYVVFVLQWLFFFQNVIFMAVTNRDNRPYLTYSKKIYAQHFPTSFWEESSWRQGKISASQELRWWDWTRLCWPHAAASCDEATSRLKVNEIQRIFGAEGWRLLWLASSNLPRDWNPFSLGFPKEDCGQPTSITKK